MIDEMFDRQMRSRLPADYPRDAQGYADTMEHARLRQAAALRPLLAGCGHTYVTLSDLICAELGRGAVSEASLRNMRAGMSVMSPRVAVALAGILGAAPSEVLPHIEAFPWLGGKFRPELAGRTWGEIASRFDVPLAVVASHLRGQDADDPTGDDPTGDEPIGDEPIDIAAIMRTISERVKSRDVRPVPSCGVTPDDVDAVPPADLGGDRSGNPDGGVPDDSLDDPAAAKTSDVVLMSITDVVEGVRLRYRGLMDLRRLQSLRELVGEVAWMTPGAFTVSRVDGHADLLFDCDLLVSRRKAGRLLAVLGSPKPRRSLLSRLLGRG